MVSPAFFSLSLNFAMRSWWSEPQSAPGLVFAVCIQFSTFCYKECNQSDFGIDHLVMSMCKVVSSVAEKGFCYDSAFSWQNSISLCSASFCIPRPKLLVIPGISWLPTFALQSPKVKRTSFLFIYFWGVLILEGLVGLHSTNQLQLLQH